MQTAPKKVINAWAMYDWANSAYNLVITSTIFPAYFEAVTGDHNDATVDHVRFLGRTFVNTSLYNYGLSFAFLMVALISPLLSSIADTRGNKKSFMSFFLILGSMACCSLFFFEGPNLNMGMACLIIACLGYWCSLVFYNSYLPEIAAPADRDRVSAKGFAYGYIGSVLLQIICFVFVFFPGIVGGYQGDPVKGTSNIQFQVCFLAVGLWWLGFALIPLKALPRPMTAVQKAADGVISNGYRELQKVWRCMQQMPVLKRFLFSFFFFNMGVQTIMLAAALYGKSELQIPTTNLIISIVLIQLIAIPGAHLISRLSEAVGNMKALMTCVVFWIVLCVAGYLIPARNVYAFYSLAIAVGFVMGGIQSLSRSTYSKLMPETKDTTSFFSFFDVTEKIAIVIGMLSFGYINELTGSQRNSVLALMIFFIIGLIGLMITYKTQKRQISL